MDTARTFRPRAGDIGTEEREVTFEPMPESVPVHEPAPAERPADVPDPVPA